MNNQIQDVQPVKLMIGIPAYGGMVHMDIMNCILNLNALTQSQRIPLVISVVTIGNQSLISVGRNKIFSIFLNSGFDYLLFLDADINISPSDILKLISYQKDIIGAPVRLKDNDKNVTNIGNIISKDEKNPNLITTDKLGTAVMLINSKLANIVKEYCNENQLFYYYDTNYTRGNKKMINQNNNIIYDVFSNGLYTNEKGEKEYLSEDYAFCKLVNKLGFDIWVDTSIVTVHNATLPLIYHPSPNHTTSTSITNKHHKFKNSKKIIDINSLLTKKE